MLVNSSAADGGPSSECWHQIGNALPLLLPCCFAVCLMTCGCCKGNINLDCRTSVPCMHACYATSTVCTMLVCPSPRRQEKIRETDTAPLLPIGPIPSCHADLYIANKACINFLFSPNSSAVVQVGTAALFIFETAAAVVRSSSCRWYNQGHTRSWLQHSQLSWMLLLP